MNKTLLAIAILIVAGSANTAIGYGGGSSIGGSIGRANASSHISTTPAATKAQGKGRVLGESTYNFTQALVLGVSGDEVTELQKVLIAEGFLAITTPTGYFGEMTQAAVRGYQTAHGITATGTVGPITRAELNGGSEPVAAAPVDPTLLASFVAQLNAIKAALAALVGAGAQ